MNKIKKIAAALAVSGVIASAVTIPAEAKVNVKSEVKMKSEAPAPPALTTKSMLLLKAGFIEAKNSHIEIGDSYKKVSDIFPSSAPLTLTFINGPGIMQSYESARFTYQKKDGNLRLSEVTFLYPKHKYKYNNVKNIFGYSPRTTRPEYRAMIKRFGNLKVTLTLHKNAWYVSEIGREM